MSHAIEPTADVQATDGAAPAAPEQHSDDGRELLDDELLVEEISIDGMCGVY